MSPSRAAFTPIIGEPFERLKIAHLDANRRGHFWRSSTTQEPVAKGPFATRSEQGAPIEMALIPRSINVSRPKRVSNQLSSTCQNLIADAALRAEAASPTSSRATSHRFWISHRALVPATRSSRSHSPYSRHISRTEYCAWQCSMKAKMSAFVWK